MRCMCNKREFMYVFGRNVFMLYGRVTVFGVLRWWY